MRHVGTLSERAWDALTRRPAGWVKTEKAVDVIDRMQDRIRQADGERAADYFADFAAALRAA